MAKACHHSMSSLKESERWMVSWSEGAVVARSIILRRKVLPAGTTLAAKLRVPMRERSSCFRQWVREDHVEPQRTYTNHTITELARCVGCFCTSSGGSSTSNLHEPHHHRSSKVCRVLLHEFRVVQAQRTYTNHTITVSKVCRALVRTTPSQS